MNLVLCITLVAGLAWGQEPAPDTTAAAANAAQASAPAPHSEGKQPVQILKQESNVEIDGYNFDFETSDGTARQETGEYRNDTEQQGLVVRGSYQYLAPDGEQISVTFIADKEGYKPTFDHGGEKNKN